MTDGHLFAHLPVTPANHFRLHFYAAVSEIVALAAPHASTSEPIAECLRAVTGYREELQACGVPDGDAAHPLAWWRNAIATWETRARVFLPARELRDAVGV